MTSNPYSPPKKEVCPPATEVGWLNKVGLVSLIFIFRLFIMLIRPCWDQYFMGLAYYTSIRSHDSQTKVGCVIVNEDNNVVSMGYNGFPKGVDDAELPTIRPEKYPFMVHAEENAVSNIITKSCNNLKVYLTHFPCHRCAKLLWQNGVKKWYIESGNLVNSTCDDDLKVYKLLGENGLQIIEIETDKSLILGSLC